MKTHIKATQLDLTPSLQTYIEDKLVGLSKFIKKFEEEGVAEIWIEIARTTKHHHKGEVFMAEADLRLPSKVLRAVGIATDARAAIDDVKDKIKLEIEKYKLRLRPRRKAE